MVCFCSVPGCGNETGRKECIRMHGFPFHSEELIQKWIKAICRLDWYPTKNSKICGDHFVPDDYISLHSNRLKSSAVPSLFLPVVVECHHEEDSPNLLKTALMNNNKVKVMDGIIIKESVVPQVCSCVHGQHSVVKPVQIGFRKRPRVLTLSEILSSKPSTSRQELVQGDLDDIEAALPAATILNASKNKTSANLKSSFQQSNSSSGSNVGISKDGEDIHLLAVKLTNLCIERNPKMYVGISKAWYENGFIKLLAQKAKLPARDVTLALMKIKLNDSFERLGHMFGTSESVASTIFSNSVNCLGGFLKEVIRWPDEGTIIKLLPIPFRSKFSKVKSIINCLEIEISQPVDLEQHTATWSKHNKCNLLKYLVACTPDGFVHFVSKGFGGSFTDTEMLAQSTHFINLLPDGCAILTEKRFENMLSLINNKSCELIILPNVYIIGTNSTKEQILFSKSITSLRVYFDRVISQMREYEIIKLRSVVDSNLIPILDDIVVIIAALINLQSPLIKE